MARSGAQQPYKEDDRWHLVIAELGHVPVVRTGGTIHQPDRTE